MNASQHQSLSLCYEPFERCKIPWMTPKASFIGEMARGGDPIDFNFNSVPSGPVSYKISKKFIWYCLIRILFIASLCYPLPVIWLKWNQNWILLLQLTHCSLGTFFYWSDENGIRIGSYYCNWLIESKADFAGNLIERESELDPAIMDKSLKPRNISLVIWWKGNQILLLQLTHWRLDTPCGVIDVG